MSQLKVLSYVFTGVLIGMAIVYGCKLRDNSSLSSVFNGNWAKAYAETKTQGSLLCSIASITPATKTNGDIAAFLEGGANKLSCLPGTFSMSVVRWKSNTDAEILWCCTAGYTVKQ